MDNVRQNERDLLAILNEQQKLEYVEIKTKIKSQLEPLLRDVKPDSPKFRHFLSDSPRIVQRIAQCGEMSSMLNEANAELAKANKTNISLKRILTLLRLVQFLTAIETAGDLATNIVLLLLAGEGEYIRLPPDRDQKHVRHARTFRDLESSNLSLGTKINFLCCHEYTFFSTRTQGWIDTDLRNKIAHADFYIDTKGEFFVFDEKEDGTKTKVKIDINRKIMQFCWYYVAFTVVFMENAPQPVKP